MGKTIYQQIANVFYAVGMADRQFVRKEKLKVIALIENHWQDETIDSEKIMHQQLKELADSMVSSSDALDNFSAYFKHHAQDFPKAIRLQLYEDAQEIALAFAGRNKSETVILSQLKHILQNND
jgi:pyoverdine/dityrosine biosynthesis protein Dit1